MAKPKKRRRRAPKKNEKPTAVARLETDIGLLYPKLIRRYRDCVTKRSDLKGQMDMFTSLGGVEHESSNVSSEIEQLDQRIRQFHRDLVSVGYQLKQTLDKAGVDADLITRLELRGWLDHSLLEDLCVRLDEWRRKQKTKQHGPKQETRGDKPVLTIHVADMTATFRGNQCKFDPSPQWKALKRLARHPGSTVNMSAPQATRLRKILKPKLEAVAKEIYCEHKGRYAIRTSDLEVRVIEPPQKIEN